MISTEVKADEKQVLCVQHRGGWCALRPGSELDPDAWSDPTACGHYVMMRFGSEVREPDCVDCRKVLR